jgi:hypothetical protein
MPIAGHSEDDELGDFSVLPPLYNLVYCSRAAAGVDDAAVARIIATSRRNNPRNGITGLLVFGSGIFFQWLEGPRDGVTRLMAHILRDARHDTIVRLSENEEPRERVFPDWDMELVDGADIRGVLTDALDEAEDEHNIEALRRLLEQLDNRQIGNGAARAVRSADLPE